MKINKKTIVHDDNPILRTKSEPVKLPLSQEDRELLLAMHKYVVDSHDDELCEKENLQPAVGIAAIQLGIPKQMCAISIPMEDNKTIDFALVNAKIISNSCQQAYLQGGEGCLSVPDEHKGYVPRSARITVKGYDLLQDKEIEFRARGYVAIVLQHELDHFDGRLFYDHINKENPFAEIEDALVI